MRWRSVLACLCLCSGCQCGGAPAPSPSPPALFSLDSPQADADVPQGADTADVDELKDVIAAVAPLHAAKRKPEPNDWLASYQEPGQSFDAYRRDDPVVPDLEAGPGKRHALYIQPLGDLTPSHTKIVELTAHYMSAFFGVPVKTTAALPLSLVPASAQRTNPRTGQHQILSSHVLDRLLLPRLPADAVAYISFTAADLWPGEGWNFVFGQASLTERVGVWSVNRYGNPDAGDEAFRRVLLRTLKVAVHETGHMFSIKHCTAHECVMGGSNNLDETDRAPLWLCPQCMAKMCWATRTDPVARYRKLALFAHEHGFTTEAQFFEKSVEAISSARSRSLPPDPH